MMEKTIDISALDHMSASQFLGSFEIINESIKHPDNSIMQSFYSVDTSTLFTKENAEFYILDACGWALDKAGFTPRKYMFYLHLALRRQCVLQDELWKRCNKDGFTKTSDNLKDIQQFCQAIVDEVVQAQQDSLAVKFFKAYYLSFLDKTRQRAHSLRLTLKGQDGYESWLTDYINYLDELANLPFVIEKAILKATENYKNYDPNKNSRVIEKILNLAIGDNGLTLSLVRVALQETLQLPDNALESLDKGLLTYIQDLKQKSNKLSNSSQEKAFFSELMNFEFYRITDVLQEAFVEPNEACANLVVNMIDKPTSLSNIDKLDALLANVPSSIQAEFLPEWILDIQQISKTGYDLYQTGKQTAQDYGGMFYNYGVSFLPEYFQNYLQSSKNKVWGEIDHSTYLAIMAFVDFFEEQNISNGTLDVLLTVYIKEVAKTQNRSTIENYFKIYQAFKNYKQIGSENFPMDFPVTLKQFELLQAINELKNLESRFYSSINDLDQVQRIFQQLIEQYKKLEKDESNSYLLDEFLKPRLTAMVERFYQKHFIPGLEKCIDNNIGNVDDLQDFYNTIKNKDLLNEDDLKDVIDGIRNGFTQELSNVLIDINRLTTHKQSNNTPKFFTPKQKAKKAIEKNISFIDTYLTNIHKIIRSEKNKFNKLRDLLEKDSNLSKAYQTKQDYLASLTKLSNSLRISLSDKKALDNIIDRLYDQGIMTPVKIINENKSKIIKELLYAGGACLVENELSDLRNNFVSLFLDQALDDTLIGQVKTAREAFQASLAENYLFSEELVDPLTAEYLVNVAVEKVIATGIAHIADNFTANNLSNYLFNHLSSDMVMSLFPYPVIGRIVYAGLTSKPVRQQFTKALASLTPEDFVSNNTKAITDRLVAYVCPSLESSIKKNLIAQTVAYVSNPESNPKEKAAQQDAFALSYLKYNALKAEKDNNTDVVVNYLFPTGVTNNDKELIKAEFESLEQKFENKKLDEEFLAKLLTDINLSDPDNSHALTVILFNRLVLRKLKAQPELSGKKLDEFNDKFNKVKNHLVELDAVIEAKYGEKLVDSFIPLEDSANPPAEQGSSTERQDDLTAAKKPSTNSYVKLTDLLNPSIEALHGMYRRQVKQQLEELKEKIKAAIQNREGQLGDDNRLGKSVVEFHFSQLSKGQITKKLLYWLIEFSSTVLLWMTLIFTFVNTGSWLAVGGAFIGLTSATSLVGIGIFAGILLLRFSIKLGIELFNYRVQLSKIWKDQDSSIFKKIAKTALALGKCVGLAALKTLFLDIIVAKISTLLAFGSFKRLAEGLYKYPSLDKITAEKKALDDFQEQLDRVIIQLNNYTGAQQNGENLKQAFNALIDETSGSDETRKSDGLLFTLKKALKISNNDARQLEPPSTGALNTAVEWNAFDLDIKKLTTSFENLQQLSIHQTSSKFEKELEMEIIDKTPEEQPKVLINLETYEAMKREKIDQNNNKVSYFSQFFGYLPKLFSTNKPNLMNAPVSTPAFLGENEKGKEKQEEYDAQGSLRADNFELIPPIMTITISGFVDLGQTKESDHQETEESTSSTTSSIMENSISFATSSKTAANDSSINKWVIINGLENLRSTVQASNSLNESFVPLNESFVHINPNSDVSSTGTSMSI